MMTTSAHKQKGRFIIKEVVKFESQHHINKEYKSRFKHNVRKLSNRAIPSLEPITLHIRTVNEEMEQFISSSHEQIAPQLDGSIRNIYSQQVGECSFAAGTPNKHINTEAKDSASLINTFILSDSPKKQNTDMLGFNKVSSFLDLNCSEHSLRIHNKSDGKQNAWDSANLHLTTEVECSFGILSQELKIGKCENCKK